MQHDIPFPEENSSLHFSLFVVVSLSTRPHISILSRVRVTVERPFVCPSVCPSVSPSIDSTAASLAGGFAAGQEIINRRLSAPVPHISAAGALSSNGAAARRSAANASGVVFTAEKRDETKTC